MLAIPDQLRAMLQRVAEALGDELLPHVAFVGGSTTALLLTDPVTREGVRFTEDVDLIVDADSRAKWVRLQEKLRARGFAESMEDDITCRMRLGDLAVDFMPQYETILGFTNRWYQDALNNTQSMPLTDTVSINLLAPAYFLATKLEAYRGRGKGDLLSSHDIEDIINLVDGREELCQELTQAKGDVRRYIAEQFTRLLADANFDYAVQGNVFSAERSEIILQRFEAIAKQHTI